MRIEKLESRDCIEAGHALIRLTAGMRAEVYNSTGTLRLLAVIDRPTMMILDAAPETPDAGEGGGE